MKGRTHTMTPNDRGAALVEYAILVALLVLVSVMGVAAAGDTFQDSLGNSTTKYIQGTSVIPDENEGEGL